ncbi:MAG: carbamoyl-phosphate synthase (glutamine-hydrolyzing) large subunit [Candidatus Cloacimonetes bacterium]|nr:carbamoyl-phosphate synthase (glutamine-hydrolyzing) large subunit [Candidatus Cloacimonadota bacterium]
MKTILVLGSGAIKIGEAGEFDYSGCQAIKGLKECGHRVVVLNPNVASTQSNGDFADVVYLKKVSHSEVKAIITKENVCSVLIGFGGQTALNCAIECHNLGIFEKYNVQVLGTSIENIICSENRAEFAQLVRQLSYEHSNYCIIENLIDLEDKSIPFNFPVFVRSNQSLGGLASGVCRDYTCLYNHCKKYLSFCDSLIIEDYLDGFKEVEYEILRDRNDSCICICSMENLDPMGIHTGDSIVVAPTQTINDTLHQKLRNAAFAIARKLELIGEFNVQFAIDPKTDKFKVIEVNARLSRSSALASKACGYPIALIAVKLCLGYTLGELKNSLNSKLSAVMEPTLDYICVKIPKWEDQRFFGQAIPIGAEMQSIGEVMAIGRSFEEAMQKGLRMVGFSVDNLNNNLYPHSRRLLSILSSMRKGLSINQLHEITNINHWFLGKLKNIVMQEEEIARSINLDGKLILKAKKSGTSDLYVAKMFDLSEMDVRSLRKRDTITPKVKMIDSVSGEYRTKSNYLYHSYNGYDHDVEALAPNKAILLIGSGSYQIGSSLEFDWCCLQTLQSINKYGFKSIFLNNNPETLSTDYDQSDRLYFEELSLEKILDIVDFENPFGVIISMSGQVGNNLSNQLQKAGIKVLGTDNSSIQICENRALFETHLHSVGIIHPKSFEYTKLQDNLNLVEYPVIIRPSKVLSGINMRVCNSSEELTNSIGHGQKDCLINEFIDNAIEIDFDGVSVDNNIIAFAICEHIERAGVHSGDSTLVSPPQNINLETQSELLKIAKLLVYSLQIKGIFNIQFMIKSSDIFVIECNLRASRTIPFISKLKSIDFIGLSTAIYLEQPFEDLKDETSNTIGVKVPQFSFQRMKNTDPNLSAIMRSTGEVAAFSHSYSIALIEGMSAVGYPTHLNKVCLIADGIEIVNKLGLEKLNVSIVCVDNTIDYLSDLELLTTYEPNDSLKEGYDLLICLSNEHKIDYQRRVIEQGIPVINDFHLACQYLQALGEIKL